MESAFLSVLYVMKKELTIVGMEVIWKKISQQAAKVSYMIQLYKLVITTPSLHCLPIVESFSLLLYFHYAIQMFCAIHLLILIVLY